MDNNSLPNQSNAPFVPPAGITSTPPTPPVSSNFAPLPVQPVARRKWPVFVTLGAAVIVVVIIGYLLIAGFISEPKYGESYQLSMQLETVFDEMWGQLSFIMRGHD